MKVMSLGLIGILISWLIVLTEKNFTHHEFFKVKKVNVNETSLYLARDIEKIEEYLRDKNILEIDIDFLKRLFDNDIRVKKVNVNVVNEGEINISVVERETKYYAQIGKEIFSMDNDGVIFASQDEKEKLDIPMFIGENNSDIKIMLEMMENIQKESFRDLISQIYRKNEYCIVLLLLDGTMIYTNEKVHKNKYETAEILYNNLVRSKKLEYMDLRFQDYVVKELGEQNEK